MIQDKRFRLKFPNKEVFEIPYWTVIKLMATQEAELRNCTFIEAKERLKKDGYFADDDEVVDWFLNNVDWGEVGMYARIFEIPPTPVNYYEKHWNEVQATIVTEDETPVRYGYAYPYSETFEGFYETRREAFKAGKENTCNIPDDKIMTGMFVEVDFYETVLNGIDLAGILEKVGDALYETMGKVSEVRPSLSRGRSSIKPGGTPYPQEDWEKCRIAVAKEVYRFLKKNFDESFNSTALVQSGPPAS